VPERLSKRSRTRITDLVDGEAARRGMGADGVTRRGVEMKSMISIILRPTLTLAL
jgi:hypothetical protein